MSLPRRFDSLRVGERFTYAGAQVEVVRAAESAQDRFGRPIQRLWCKRLDTDQEGFISYGEGGVFSDAY